MKKRFIPLMLAAAFCLPTLALAEDAVSSASVANFYTDNALTGDDLMNAINSTAGFYLVSTTNPDGSPNAAYFIFGMTKLNDQYYLQLRWVKLRQSSSPCPFGQELLFRPKKPSPSLRNAFFSFGEKRLKDGEGFLYAF